MESLERTVRRMLTGFGGCDQPAARRWQHLKKDLYVTPLEMELVALEVEQLMGMTLPLDDLVAVQTVGDLLTFIFHAVRGKRRERAHFGATPKKCPVRRRTRPLVTRAGNEWGLRQRNETTRRAATDR